MKLRRIETINNEVLGDFIVDFTNEDGKVVNTLIIAGENGVGKSYLLNLLFEFSNLSLSSTLSNEVRKFEVELSDEEIDIIKTNEAFKQYLTNGIKDNIISIVVDYRLPGNWSQFKITATNSTGQVITLPSALFNQAGTKRILKSIFSDVEINFTPQAIQSVTSKNIDVESKSSIRSNQNLATEITQLLVDVQSLDALDFSEWARNCVGQPIDESKLDTRIRRFTNAFHYMFPSKKYKRIGNMNNSKAVIFEENGREMSINKLSSGEKQIVFRGSFLLKDKGSSKGALVFIDEPEISLHPTWQLKILNFFKKLFTDDNGEQTSQIIVTTHSPFIIHNANRIDDKVIVLIKDSQGNVGVSQHPKFYSWSNEKAIEHAFNVSHVLNNHKMTVFVEGETDEKYLNKCMSVYRMPNSEVEFKWIGRINEKGSTENSGDTALNQARTFFLANMDMIKGAVTLLYDSDTNKPEEDVENLFVRKMKFNKSNSLFKIGIENLLVIPEDFDLKDFYKETRAKDNYGGEIIKKQLEKNKLCSAICDNTSIENQKIILEKVSQEVERVLVDVRKYFKIQNEVQ